jgi:hypothetical protein
MRCVESSHLVVELIFSRVLLRKWGGKGVCQRGTIGDYNEFVNPKTAQSGGFVGVYFNFTSKIFLVAPGSALPSVSRITFPINILINCVSPAL